ncbi:hypothetical protein L7F22_033825 [Adiantum nelumboides]|nr:hypothetical protein [Adiantum nelumboides]
MTFARYDECGGQLNPKKCHLAQPRVKLLGHIIFENGIEADLEKVEALLLLSSPKDTRQLATFIQKVKYLSRFIHLASQLLYPLQQAIKKDPLEWTHECEDVFDKVKDVLIFKYIAPSHTVLQVTKEDYKDCKKDNALFADAKGDTTIPLIMAGQYWFICGVGNHCS